MKKSEAITVLRATTAHHSIELSLLEEEVRRLWAEIDTIKAGARDATPPPPPMVPVPEVPIPPAPSLPREVRPEEPRRVPMRRSLPPLLKKALGGSTGWVVLVSGVVYQMLVWWLSGG